MGLELQAKHIPTNQYDNSLLSYINNNVKVYKNDEQYFFVDESFWLILNKVATDKSLLIWIYRIKNDKKNMIGITPICIPIGSCFSDLYIEASKEETNEFYDRVKLLLSMR